MAVIDVDFNIEDVEEGFPTLPPDQYAARIKEVELTKSSNNNDMLVFLWEVTEGDYVGRQVKDRVTLMKSTAFKIKPYANLAGIESGTRLDTTLFPGLEAILTITLDPGPNHQEGDPLWNNIKKIVPVG